MNFRRNYCFDDVCLVPQYNPIDSRWSPEIDFSFTIKNLKLKVPIISAPMTTVTNGVMCEQMNMWGGMGITHRYCSITDQVQEVKKANAVNIGGAIGIKDDYIERAQELLRAGCNVLCVDVAHGDSQNVFNAIINLQKSLQGKEYVLIAGNIGTVSAAVKLKELGVDILRVGIAGGGACQTYETTGHMAPTFQSVWDCAGDGRVILADGGIRHSGDACKALAAGASLIMLGKVLGETYDAPGVVISKGGVIYKEYAGMASAQEQEKWRGKVSVSEGASGMIPVKGCVRDVLQKFEAGVRSGMTYSGVKTIPEWWAKAQFAEITPNGNNHGRAHGFNI